MFRCIRFFIGLFFLSVGFAEGGGVLSPIVPAADGEAVGVESDAAAYHNGSGAGKVVRKVRRSLGIKAKMALASSVGSPPANRTIPSAKTRFLKKGRVVGGNPKVKIPQRFLHQPVQQIRVPEKGQEIRRASSRGGYRPGGHASQSGTFQFFVSFSFSFSTIRWAHLLMSPQPKVRIRSPGRAFFTT